MTGKRLGCSRAANESSKPFEKAESVPCNYGEGEGREGSSEIHSKIHRVDREMKRTIGLILKCGDGTRDRNGPLES